MCNNSNNEKVLNTRSNNLLSFDSMQNKIARVLGRLLFTLNRIKYKLFSNHNRPNNACALKMIEELASEVFAML